MSAEDRQPGERGACATCLRRSWLLAELGGPLDCNCRADGRLFDLLALGDDELIAALGGRRRRELQASYARFSPADAIRDERVREVCRHDSVYPQALSACTSAPATLYVLGSRERLARLTARPVVAVIGTSRATDYGIAMAASLARGLAASGVTVAGEPTGEIGAAALAGAMHAHAALAVLAGGVDVAAPARRRALLARIEDGAAAVGELPCGTQSQRWSCAAAARTVAGLAELTIVVEADCTPRELAGAGLAHALGRAVAAVPGRVTSRASRGSNALLRDGASLVRDAGDALDLLGHCDDRLRPTQDTEQSLSPHLRELLERVGEGFDTPARLAGDNPAELLHALSELELLGLLARGDGGRYVPTDALGAPPRYGSAGQMEP